MTPSVLLVDASAADRARIREDLASLGLTVEEAPDGIEAFEALLASPVDLVVTEVELPRLDGPGLIGRMRAHGVKTPVLVLTAVSKASTVGALMKLGIAAYVHKSTPADLLRQKILAVLPQQPEAAIAAPPTPAPAGPAETEGPTSGAALLVDAVASERERVRALLPSSVTLDGCAKVDEALALSHANPYRMVLFDADASVLNLSGIVAQLHLLRPEAPVVAIATVGKTDDEARLRASLAALGFDEVLIKPLQPRAVTLLAERYCTTWEELVTVHDDVVVVSRLACRADHHERYFNELAARLTAAFRPLCEACFEHALLDLTRLPDYPPVDVLELLARVEKAATALGLGLPVVVSQKMSESLRGFAESFADGRFRWFTSVSAARAAIAA